MLHCSPVKPDLTGRGVITTKQSLFLYYFEIATTLFSQGLAMTELSAKLELCFYTENLMSDICFLRPTAAKRIENWLNSNDYSLHNGYFTLEYEFSPIVDDEIILSFIDNKTGDTHKLVVQDDIEGIIESDEECSVSEITIDYIPLPLELTPETLEKFSGIASKKVEAEVEEAVEPEGCGIKFEIYLDGYVIFACNKEIQRTQIGE